MSKGLIGTGQDTPLYIGVPGPKRDSSKFGGRRRWKRLKEISLNAAGDRPGGGVISWKRRVLCPSAFSGNAGRYLQASAERFYGAMEVGQRCALSKVS